VGRLVRLQCRLGARGRNGLLAGVAMMNTFVAPAAGLLAWMGASGWSSGKPSMLGGASGAVAGLVAVTPAAGRQRPDRGNGPLARRASLSLLRVRRIGEEPASARRQPRRVSESTGSAGSRGSIGTAIVAIPALGGHGGRTMRWWHQLAVQFAAVAVAIAGLPRAPRCALPPSRRSSRCAGPGTRSGGARHLRSWRAGLQLLSFGQEKGSPPEEERARYWGANKGGESQTAPGPQGEQADRPSLASHACGRSGNGRIGTVPIRDGK
jgi:hypothetical protein